MKNKDHNQSNKSFALALPLAVSQTNHPPHDHHASVSTAPTPPPLQTKMAPPPPLPRLLRRTTRAAATGRPTRCRRASAIESLRCSSWTRYRGQDGRRPASTRLEVGRANLGDDHGEAGWASSPARASRRRTPTLESTRFRLLRWACDVGTMVDCTHGSAPMKAQPTAATNGGQSSSGSSRSANSTSKTATTTPTERWFTLAAVAAADGLRTSTACAPRSQQAPPPRGRPRRSDTANSRLWPGRRPRARARTAARRSAPNFLTTSQSRNEAPQVPVLLLSARAAAPVVAIRR